MEQIFVSSVQKELQNQRIAIRDYVHKDDLLRQFFRVFLFEDLPPADQRADDVYLEEVSRSSIYVGIFGNEYGWQDDEGLSPTEKEFNQASLLKKRRLIFINGDTDKNRHPKMKALIKRAGDQVIRRRFRDKEQLERLLYGSLIQYLQDQGFIATADFDATPCTEATLKNISLSKLKWFIKTARTEHKFPLSVNTSPKNALAHLNLIARDNPAKGAVLLFCKKPKQFIYSADLVCLHYPGTEIQKPILSQQVYNGTLFEQVDNAVAFVMDRITRSVQPGNDKPESNVEYEIPYPAVREAIVNAVAHRNYGSNSSVQVTVFADRIEVWNPGGLPENLTVDQLREPHPSIPRNRLLCEPLYLARYIERAGTGTIDMIRVCKNAGLPEPEFCNMGERFVTVLWRNWLTDEVIVKLGLNEREKEAITYVKNHGRITNKEYQELTGVTDRTALREFKKLMEKGVFEKVGKTGRSTYYILKQQTRHKPDKPDR